MSCPMIAQCALKCAKFQCSRVVTRLCENGGLELSLEGRSTTFPDGGFRVGRFRGGRVIGSAHGAETMNDLPDFVHFGGLFTAPGRIKRIAVARTSANSSEASAPNDSCLIQRSIAAKSSGVIG